MITNLRCCCITAAAVVGLVQIASAADVTGKITLKGKPPAEIPLPLDQSCGKLNSGPATTHHWRVGPNGEFGDVLVYIKEGAKPSAPPAEPKVLDQQGCQYTPFIFGLQTKQKLIIKNSDPGVLHNVHVMPDPKSGNKESNQAQLKGQDLVKTFDNPEIFLHFKCDVHNWMHAYAAVVDNPYYSVSEQDGSFKIANLPPGKYVVEAIHRKAGKQIKEITVTDQPVTIDFTFEVPAK